MVDMSTSEMRVERRDVLRRWSLVMPALVVITLFSVIPLGVMVVYSLLASGPYGNVVWDFSIEGWISVFLE